MGNSSYFWKEEEVQALKTAYHNGGGLAEAVKVIDKSRGTIAAKASRLGITVPKPRTNTSSMGTGGSSSSSDSSMGT
jgi:hypothetical protein